MRISVSQSAGANECVQLRMHCLSGSHACIWDHNNDLRAKVPGIISARKDHSSRRMAPPNRDSMKESCRTENKRPRTRKKMMLSENGELYHT